MYSPSHGSCDPDSSYYVMVAVTLILGLRLVVCHIRNSQPTAGFLDYLRT